MNNIISCFVSIFHRFFLQIVCKIKEVLFLLDLYCSMTKLVLYCCTAMNLFIWKYDTFLGNLLKLI